MNKTKRRIAFIASSPHSGSTLLELLIGSHSCCVGIGEVFQLITPRNDMLNRTADMRCPCGDLVDECRFWEPIIHKFRTDDTLTQVDKYRFVFQRFDQCYSRENVLIDSSKLIPALRLINSIDDVDLKVIHLIKDVRAWVVSMKDTYYRKDAYLLKNLIRNKNIKLLHRYLLKYSLYNFHNWYRTQKKIDKFLHMNNIPSLFIGYEQLCFSLEDTMKKICTFIGLEYEEKILSTMNTNMHSLFGNRMRFQAEKRQTIVYDNRWFYKNHWLLPSLLCPHVMSYNRKYVYHQKSSLWDQ